MLIPFSSLIHFERVYLVDLLFCKYKHVPSFLDKFLV